MNSKEYRQESDRWYRQGEADLAAAGDSLRMTRFEWASFQAQQSGEKFLKAVWYAHGLDPWGHSLMKLIQDFPANDAQPAMQQCLSQARYLDKMYIPTRYPNGLPDIIPAEAFSNEDASRAIQCAGELKSMALRILKS